MVEFNGSHVGDHRPVIDSWTGVAVTSVSQQVRSLAGHIAQRHQPTRVYLTMHAKLDANERQIVIRGEEHPLFNALSPTQPNVCGAVPLGGGSVPLVGGGVPPGGPCP